MSKIEEFKKKYNLSSQEEEEEKVTSSPIEEFKKKYNITTKDEADVLGSYNPSKRTSKVSQIVSSNFDNMGTSVGIDGYNKYLDDLKASTEPKEDEKWWEAIGRYLGSGGSVDTSLPLGTTTQVIHDLSVDNSHRRPNDDWSEKQKSKFGELYLTNPESAFSYGEQVNAEINKRKEEEAIKVIQGTATSSFGAGAAHTVGAIATAPLGLADYLEDLAMANAGRDIAPDGTISPFEYSQAVTGGISEHLNEKGGTLNEDIPIIGGKGWGDVYGLGTSIAQSMVSAYTLGGAGTLVSYFGQGAAAGVDDALSRGATEGQAVIYGSALGVFEGLAEKIGVDNLFKLGSTSTVKGLIKNILKQAGAEGGEEFLTSLFSNIADNVIMRGKSNFYALVEQYMASGMNESEAKTKAWWDSVEGIAFDTIAGAVSGGVSGGIHSGVNTALTNANAKKNYSGQVEDLLIEAGTNSDTGKAVDKYINKYGKKGELSGWNISHLLEITDSAKIKSAIETKLSTLGEKGDISKIADVLTKKVNGLELSKSEQKILDNSTYGQRMSNTLDPENIMSGEYETGWSENIGTRRTNAKAYNKGKPLSNLPKGRVNTNITPHDDEEKGVEASNISTEDVKVTIERDGETVEVNPQKIASIESDSMTIELEDGEVVDASEVNFGGQIGLVYQAAKDMSSRVGGFSVDTANVFVGGYNEASGQSAGAYIDGWISAYKFGAMKNPPPLSALAANPKTAQLTEEQRKTAYNFGRAFGKEPVATGKKSEGFVGEYTKRSYNSEQAELLSALPVEALQNAVDSNGALSFNAIGLGGDQATQQKWIEAGLTYTEDGKVYVDENAVLDERDRRRKATKEAKSAEVTSKKETAPMKKGRVIFDGERYGKRLNERQRASLKALNFIAKALGIDIYVDKLAKGDNGWYDPKDRSIHVDLYAGVEAEALMLFAAAHELTHDIRATLPEKFNLLADAVFEEYTKRYSDHVMEDLIDAKIDFLKEKGDITEDMTEEEAYDRAFEEVICDCCETLLADSNAIEALSQNIYAKDKTLWQKIKDFFARIVARIKAEYADVVPDTEEGQRFRDLGEGAERIKKLWVEAIVELSETDHTTGEGNVKHSYSSIAYSFFGDKKVSIKDLENGSYKDTEGYKSYVDQCLNNMRQTSESFNEKASRKEIVDSIDGIVEVAVAMKKAGYDILDSEGGRNVRDSKKRLLFSSLEPNSDYFTSSDISTICDKRINFAEIYDEIVRREDEMGVPKNKRFFNNIDNYFVLHKILAEKGLTAPCRQCYVESMRKNLDPMANAFIELMQETDPNNKANKQLYQPSGKNKGELKSNNAKLRENLLEVIEREQYDITAEKLTIKMLTTADGLAQLKLQAPLIYEAFNSFYGQSKPKMPKAATPFRFGELTALLTDDKGKIKAGLIKQIVSTGGFRLQSYSDFQIQNFADVLQVIFEAGTLGLNGHAYTKVPAFLDATKGTNLKRNISIFMYKDGGQWKIDRGDSFPYTLEEIYDIVDADKYGNTGIIAVVQNEDMAAWIMANDNIGYFIPFHKSGVKMGVVRETIVREGGREIKGYSGIKDHTRQQTEVWAKTTADHKANTKVKKGINIYEFWDFDNAENLSQKELIKKNVMAYIDACNEAGYLPKFREYVTNNSKVLNAVLNYSKQFGFVSQNATIDDISFEYSGYRIPYGYYKCLGDFGMFTPDGEASPIERLSLKNYNFKEAVKFFSDAKTLRRNEILQQFENGSEREKYRESKMTTAELAEEVQNRRNQVVDEVVSGEYKKKKYSHTADQKATYSDRDSSYMDAVSRGDMETAQRMVDEAAYTKNYVVAGYHGTPNGGFTKFGGHKTRNGAKAAGSYWFSEELNHAKVYKSYPQNYPAAENPMVYNVYLDIGNWADIGNGRVEALDYSIDGRGAATKELRAVAKAIAFKTQYKHNGQSEAARARNITQQLTEIGRNIYADFIWQITETQEFADLCKKEGLDAVVAWEEHREYDSNGERKTHMVKTYGVFSSEQIKSADPVTYDNKGNVIPLSERFNPKNSDIRYSHKADKKASYAPAFYSHMGKVIDEVKLDKMGTSSILNHLKNRGVKDEEIKWSGIETFLEGKKSVTKAELQEFVAGSQLQIEEEMTADEKNADIQLVQSAQPKVKVLYIDGKYEDIFRQNEYGQWVSDELGDIFFDEQEILDQVKRDYARNAANTRWSQYKLDGGTNYRELVFKMADSTYSNRAMRGHWGQDAEGILVHARIQDFEVDGKKMLFIEELQSDWHNEGHEKGYTTKEYEDAVAVYDKLAEDYANKRKAFNQYVRSSDFRSDPDEVSKKKFDWLRSKMETAEKRMQAAERDIEALKEKGMGDVADAPFRGNYHEYVLKRLLRMAAEEGYDSIGWTIADTQSKRWSYDYEKAYQIEYDQEMPKFLRKYGKKWGATVGYSYIRNVSLDRDYYEEQIADIESEIEQYRDELDDDNTEDYNVFIQEGISDLQNTLSNLYNKLRGEKIWSMDITDSMKDSVLYEGQPKYSHKADKKASYSGSDTSNLIGKEVMFYEEGDRKPDLTLVEVVNERTGKTETTVKFIGDMPKDYIPEKVAYCYKLFEQHPDGTLHALFAGASNATPIGEWQYAKGFPYTDSGVKGMNLRERYGWHLSAGLPSAPHLMSSKSFERGYPSKNAFGHPKGSKRVWVRMAYDASTDFNSLADSTKEGDIFGLIPFGGYYAFKENNHSEWVISSGVKIDKILTEDERQQILKDAGYDEYEAWRKKHRATEAEKAESKRQSAENKKAKDRAKKEGRNYLSESAKEMRESIKSRIIVNPEISDIKHQHRATNGMKPRTLLANALETAAQNDIERNKLKQYKEKIGLLNAEEQKLYELEQQISELYRKKGTRDTEAIKKLRFDANQAANRINTYDRQLFNLESTKALKGVLEREKAQARKRAEQKAEERRKDAVARVKESAAKTQREIMTRYQESRKKATESRNKTAMRHKIRNVVKDLNKLLNRGTKDRNVKEELRETVASSLALAEMLFNDDIRNEDIVRLGVESVTEKESKLLNEYSDLLDTIDALYDKREYFYGTEKVREELLTKVGSVEEQIAKVKNRISTLNSKLSEVFERERARINRSTASQLMANLANEYRKLKDSDTDYIRAAYDEYIFTRLDSLKDTIGGTIARDMSLEQLTEVYDAYKMVEHFVRNANKAFKANKGETIMQMAEAVNGQVRDIAGQPYKHNVIKAAAMKIGWKFLKPFVAFRTIGSVTLTNLYKELRVGEDVFYNDVKAAQAFIEEQYEKYNYKSWDFKKPQEFTAKSGKTFELTLEQRMSLYAYYKREKAHKHIVEGGIVFEDSIITEKTKLGIPIAYQVTTKDAFNLSEETFAEIANSLTDEQQAFVDAMQQYLSTVMGEKGNEVSMALHGVKLFKEEFYLPIKSSEFYMNFKPEEAGEVRLKSPAFSKETTPHANNPIVLHNFTDLWAEHVNNMSMYHSFVLALEDFTRVYNYKTKTDAKVETMDTKATLETAYPGVTNYINKFLKDMNGGVRSETVGWADKLTSLSKKGAVLGSASVAIQQPSAVMRAMAMINPKYFITTAHKSLNLLKHKQDWAELKKYAPIAGIKEMGRFDVGMGQSTVDWIQSNKTLMEKGEDILSAAPAFMDEVTWVTIWNAVKRETAHYNPTLRTNSDEFLQLAGERFTDVISMTQVYDSVFSRSDLMRNKSWIAKAVTAFMAEPTTTLNMIWDAWVQAKRTGGVKAYGKAVVTTGAPIMASIVLNAALKSIIMAMRDDDEDESYGEKYLESFFGEIKDNLNPLTLIPIAKDVVSIFRGYDVERMDMALISDLKKAIDAFDSEEKTLYEKWSGLIGAISAFCGIPAKNVERDIRGLITTIFGESEDTTAMGILNAIEEGWTGEAKSNGQQLYEAMLKGDSEQIERVKGRFESESAINSAIRKALRENDPRIKEAAEAKIDGDSAESNRIAEEIAREGHFSKENIKAAIKSEINDLTKDDTSKEDSGDDKDEEISFYDPSDINVAFENGDTALAKEIIADLIKTKVANGKTEKEAKSSLRSSMTSYWKPIYKEASASERTRIRKILYNSGLYGNADEVIKSVDAWLKD